MSKSSNTTTIKNIDIHDDWSSHPAVEWLSANKTWILFTFLGLLAALIVTYRFVSIRTLNAENDFFQVQTAFTQFQKDSITSQSDQAAADLQQLVAIMQQHPEIKPKYQGPLAQTLLINGQIPQAQQFADDIFKRTQPDHLQYYQDYSRASLLIGEGHYSDALRQTQELKFALDQLDHRENSLLYVFNLLRLAILYQLTNQPSEELKTWNELGNQTNRLEAFLAANRIFKVGHASLNQYIEQRKKILE